MVLEGLALLQVGQVVAEVMLASFKVTRLFSQLFLRVKYT